MVVRKKRQKHQVEASYSKWLDEFQAKRKERLQQPESFISGLHPSKTGIGKKDTSFYKGCCHVGFHRKTFPKSGKSIVDGCFIQKKDHYYLIYDIETRALLGLDLNKIEKYKRILNGRIKNDNWL